MSADLIARRHERVKPHVLIVAGDALVFAVVSLLRHRPEPGVRWDRARFQLLAVVVVALMIGVPNVIRTGAGDLIRITCAVIVFALLLAGDRRL